MPKPNITVQLLLAASVGFSVILLCGCTSSGPCDRFKKEPSLKDVPIYSGATIVATGAAPNTRYTRTQLTTTADPLQVVQFYRQALASEGWDIDPDEAQKIEVKGHYGNCCHYGSINVSLEQSPSG